MVPSLRSRLTAEKSNQQFECASSVSVTDRKDSIIANNRTTTSIATDESIPATLSPHDQQLQKPCADNRIQNDQPPSRWLGRHTTRSSTRSVPTIQTAVAAPIVKAKEVSVKSRKTQFKETFDEISPISPLSLDEPVTPDQPLPPRPLKRKVRGVEFDMMNESGSNKVDINETLLDSTVATRDFATTATARKTRSQTRSEQCRDNEESEAKRLEQSMRKVKITHPDMNEKSISPVKIAESSGNSTVDAGSSRARARALGMQLFNACPRNRISQKSASHSTDQGDDRSSNGSARSSQSERNTTNDAYDMRTENVDKPLSTYVSQIPIMPPVYPTHVTFKTHWTSQNIDSSRPVEDWAVSKRWWCHECHSETIVEQRTCANLSCEHVRCAYSCQGPERKGWTF